MAYFNLPSDAASAPPPASDSAPKERFKLPVTSRPADSAPPTNWSKLFAIGDLGDWWRVASSNVGGDLIRAHLATGDYVAPQDEAYAANVAKQHALTEAAQNRQPPFGAFTANAAGFAPYAALSGPIGESLGPAFNYGAPLTRKLLGTVAANTIGGGTSAAVRGEDPVKGAIAGGVTGLVGAPLGGAADLAANKTMTPVGRVSGLLSTPEKVRTSTASASTDAYNAARQFGFSPRDVNMVRSATMDTFDPAEQASLSSSMRAKIVDHTDAINNQNTVNASNIDNYGRGLFSAARNPLDNALASRLKDNLDNFMGWGQPTTGQTPGQALLAIESARQAAQQKIMGEQLPQVIQKVQREGLNPGEWAKEQAQFYKDSNPQTYDQLIALYRKMGGGGALPSGQSASHVAADVAEATAGAVGMPDAGLVVGPGIQLMKAPISGMMKGFKQRSAINDLYNLYPDTTGQSVVANTNIPGTAVRAGLGGFAAGGYYPPYDQQNQ